MTYAALVPPELFGLDPRIAHLNHASFGAVPVRVREAQRRWQERADANPMRFHRVELDPLLAAARAAVAAFLGLPEGETALVRSATEGIATALRSAVMCGHVGAGDEVVTSSHGYGSTGRVLTDLAARTGLVPRTATVPLGADESAWVDAISGSLTERTRVVLLDQVTSDTAVVVPVRAVVRAVRRIAPAAMVVVDGAHAPGHLSLSDEGGSLIPGLGADWWTGTLHKWALTARGCAAMWVAPSWRERVVAGSPSHEVLQGYPVALDRPGNGDTAPWLSLPEALRLRAGTMTDDVVDELVHRADAMVDRLGGSAYGGGSGVVEAPLMRLVPLPGVGARTPAQAAPVYEALSRAGVEVQVVGRPEGAFLRVSSHAYVSSADVDRLAAATGAL